MFSSVRWSPVSLSSHTQGPDSVEALPTQLAEEGHHIVRPAVGIMVEVPAAVALLPFIARRIDFISIGSNDLAQYLLAVDRNNPRVSRLFDNLHPAVIHEIRRMVSTARQCDLQVGLC